MLVEFTPNTHIESTENAVSYFIAGADVLQLTQVLGSLYGAKAITKRTFREQHPMIGNADAEAAHSREEELEDAAMQAIQASPLIDQRTLASKIGLDTSTMGGVIDRLEARELLQRNKSPGDRRVKLVSLTEQGEAALASIQPAMAKAQERILAPLTSTQQAQFMTLLNILVESNNELSRAPIPRTE